jgi:hypothetical protein
MIMILFKEGSDDFWKCLKYDTTDALTNPTYFVNAADKYKMIQQNTEYTKIKRLRYSDDIATTVHSEIRIFDDFWEATNVRLFDVGIGFEIISHTVYSRLNVFRNEILRLFNRRVVDGNIAELSVIGLMGKSGSFNNGFQGYKFTIMGTST